MRLFPQVSNLLLVSSVLVLNSTTTACLLADSVFGTRKTVMHVLWVTQGTENPTLWSSTECLPPLYNASWMGGAPVFSMVRIQEGTVDFWSPQTKLETVINISKFYRINVTWCRWSFLNLKMSPRLSWFLLVDVVCLLCCSLRGVIVRVQKLMWQSWKKRSNTWIRSTESCTSSPPSCSPNQHEK